MIGTHRYNSTVPAHESKIPASCVEGMQNAYKIEPTIIEQRHELAKSFSALRRIRPRVPFWCLAAHRIPTLWTLYRGLMRHAPGDNIRWRMRMFFERYRALNSPVATRERLLQAHKFLDCFRAAADGDNRLQKILARYDAMIKAKRSKEELKGMILEELAWQDRLRNRPIMTGGLLKPSILNKALPRLKPQPNHISMMMYRRQLAYERMGETYGHLRDHEEAVAMEAKFEEKLLREVKEDSSTSVKWFDPEFYRADGWNEFIENQKKSIRASIGRAVQRAHSNYTPEMLEAIKEARREKIRNKTRERERERRGEVLPCTIRRSRKRPPAHVLEKMPEWKRRADEVIRSTSEVGYVGMMKSRLGVKMKNPNLWRELEEGGGKESGAVLEAGKKGQEEGNEEGKSKETI